MNEKWEEYIKLVYKWQPVANLFSESDINKIDYHINDVCKGLEFIKENKIIDAGSGNGIITVCAYLCGKSVIAVEKRKKKYFFLKEIKRELNMISVSIVNQDFSKMENKENIPYVLRGVEKWENIIKNMNGLFYIFASDKMIKGKEDFIIGEYEIDGIKRYIIKIEK